MTSDPLGALSGRNNWERPYESASVGVELDRVRRRFVGV